MGRPTRPTSASSRSRNSIQPSSPGSPRSAKRGAWRVGVAKRLLPRPPEPPRAIVARWPWASSSQRRPAVVRVALLAVPRASVPGGTRIVKASPSAPCLSAPFAVAAAPGVVLGAAPEARADRAASRRRRARRRPRVRRRRRRARRAARSLRGESSCSRRRRRRLGRGFARGRAASGSLEPFVTRQRLKW